ncbi:hypothetical protein ACFQ0B_56140 [Nonomuraea thailandensis]
MPLGALIFIAVTELVRLALVTWSGVGPAEAAWAALVASLPWLLLVLGIVLTPPAPPPSDATTRPRRCWSTAATCSPGPATPTARH